MLFSQINKIFKIFRAGIRRKTLNKTRISQCEFQEMCLNRGYVSIEYICFDRCVSLWRIYISIDVFQKRISISIEEDIIVEIIRRKEDGFHKLLQEGARLVDESTKLLKTALNDPSSYTVKMDEINSIEHKADDLTNAILQRLHKTLVTPMDREDIFLLATTLDDIVDFVQGALERLIMCKVDMPIEGVKGLVDLFAECVNINETSISYLPNIKGRVPDIMKNAQRVSALESEGDKLYRHEMAKLFQEEKNPIEIIKWKEILEHLEDGLDRCEDLSDLIKGAVLKYA